MTRPPLMSAGKKTLIVVSILRGEVTMAADADRRVTRKVGGGGRISLAGHKYHVGRWLAGEAVDIVIADGLIEISHCDVLIASHARQHRVAEEPAVWQREPRARPIRPETVGVPVTRKVDSSGNVSFAAIPYRVGNAMRGLQVQVRVVGDTVEISTDGRIIRSHVARHDPAKEHGAFANPAGRPRRINPASQSTTGISHAYRSRDAARVPELDTSCRVL